jgi:hypothetical protein
MERENLIELRPLITGAQTEGAKTIEYFQNGIIRPIIKYQHPLILLYFKENIHFQQLIKSKTTRRSFEEQVKVFIGNQSNIKHQFIGTIIGLFTEEEFVFYLHHTAELNKRIYQMICQRVADTFY